MWGSNESIIKLKPIPKAKCNTHFSNRFKSYHLSRKSALSRHMSLYCPSRCLKACTQYSPRSSCTLTQFHRISSDTFHILLTGCSLASGSWRKQAARTLLSELPLPERTQTIAFSLEQISSKSSTWKFAPFFPAK